MKKLNLLVIIFILSASGLYAQDTSAFTSPYRSIMSVSWCISTPLNNLDFISTSSVEGGQIGYYYFVTPRIAAGADVTWNSVSQYKSRRTYFFSDGAVTTDRINSLYTIPLAARGRYFLSTSPHFFSWVGIGLGAVYSEMEIFYSIFHEGDANWGFLASPEAGITFIPKDTGRFGIHLSAQYNYSTNKEEALAIKNLQALNVLVGVSFFK
jgi:hypothetical protein